MDDFLVEELASSPEPGLRQWLFDPFTYLAGGSALALGLAAILLASFVGSLTSTHFDGVLDIHTGRAAPLGTFLAEGLVDWLSISIVLLILGRIVSKTSFRSIDMLGTQAMARWPTLIAAIATLAPPYQRYVAQLSWKLLGVGEQVPLHSTDPVFFGVIAIVSILVMIWMVMLMYRAYTVCCNISGARAPVTFIIGLIVSEVVSKITILRLLMLQSS
ncbi:MAG: hypothetical protein IMF16_05475 [Proteobacteria bacterium]|nr:hypothetical protein [Pseudomonadota bacterium]